MADPNTLRVLAIDGGGMKGIGSAAFMQDFVELWGINPYQIWKYFDVICGTSVGGIQALGYASGLLSPSDMINFFINDGPWIFSTSTILPGQRASTLSKIITMVLGGTFYTNTNLLNQLNTFFGTLTLNDLNTSVVCTSFDYDQKIPILFSNIDFPYSIGQDELASNVAYATAAAPLFFPPANWDGTNYIDGGVIKNNPALLGLTLGKIQKPNANRFCVLSLGCGLGEVGFHNIPPPPDPPTDYFPNMNLLYSLLNIGIKGNQEVDAAIVETLADYTLENLFEYRAQVLVDPSQDSGLDNTDTEFTSYMQAAFANLFSTDAVNISNFLGHLTA
jgi:predicted acylesterase/phospholipase RssA